MKYCKKCKKLVFDDTEKCDCGKKLNENAKSEDIIYLTDIKEYDKEIVENALKKKNIPYSVTLSKNRTQPFMDIVKGDYSVFVPAGFLKQTIDALEGIAFEKKPDYYDKLDFPEEPEWEEMSPVKRKAVQVLSALFFIFLIFLCVTGVDAITAFITKLFGG